MIEAVQSLTRIADAALARLYLALFRERDALLCFLFHSLFRDRREIDLNLIDPLERTTVADFRELIEYYLSAGYTFISPDELLAGLPSPGKYAMITFDDGYYNNHLALPVLEELKVPAVFFISTNHVMHNKCFWWDVFYRERVAQGASGRKLHDETVQWKSMRTHDIEAELMRRFGPRAFEPRGDIDRPFTPAELRQFAGSPFVHLGNHTADHAILTNYDRAEARRQVEIAQAALAELTGKTPTSIAYPNGAVDDAVARICQEANLRLGFTIRPQKVPLPLDPQSPAAMRLGRFVPHAHATIRSQCRTYRSDVQLYGLLRQAYLKCHPNRPGS